MKAIRTGLIILSRVHENVSSTIIKHPHKHDFLRILSSYSGTTGGPKQSHTSTIAVFGLGFAAIALTATLDEARCESSNAGGWMWRSSWFLPWSSHSKPNNQHPTIQAALKQDPKVAVVVSYGLPLLSLAFGWAPTAREMKAADTALGPHIDSLHPWEVVILLWGAAHTGYVPSKSSLTACQKVLTGAQASSLARHQAAMVAWALAVMGVAQEYLSLWSALIERIEKVPVKELDEVTLVYLFQAALFASHSSSALSPNPSSSLLPTGLRSSVERSKALLIAYGASPGLAEAAHRVYCREVGSLPAFDGPILVELSLVRIVESIMSALSTDTNTVSAALETGGEAAVPGGPVRRGFKEVSAYEAFFSDLRRVDLERAQQLQGDKYLLEKLKRDIADRHQHHSELGRRLANISRTLKDLGLHSVTQTTVEEGLVAVDLALTDYKIAFFLEPHPITSLTSIPSFSSSPSTVLSRPDTETVGALAGYACSDTPGSRQAKLRVLEQHGWVALPITWEDMSGGNEAERRHKILALLDKAGREQLMKGRVNAVVHGALRGAQESKLAGDRYGKASVGSR